MKPTNEQKREFWEWCGTEGINYYEGDTALGFLFKYAVPKLLGEGWDIMISHNQEFKTWDVELSHPTKQAILEQETTLVTTLFWAIWKVNHKGNDET